MRTHARLIVAALFILSTGATAQVVESPVPFDSAGRLRVITPSAVARLSLAPPGWPVSRPFVEARLYQISTGGFVIVAERSDGTIERHALTAEERSSLRQTISQAMTATTNVRNDVLTASGGNARNAFVRNQTLLTAAVYAPAAASLANDTKARTAVWLLSTGGSFFALAALTRDASITDAQNHLSTDGGLRGAILTNGTLHALGVDLDDDVGVGAGLAGALGGAILGYKSGKGLTIHESHARTAGSTFLGLTALGVAASLGTFDDGSSRRGASAAGVASAALGYVAGPRYVRKSSYTVTSGDIGMMRLTGVLGAATGIVPFLVDDVNERSLAAAATAGLMLGVLGGDIAFTRPFDHTTGESWRAALGAVAGALVGGAAVVLAEPEARGGASMVVGGAWLGAIVTNRLIKPKRAR